MAKEALKLHAEGIIEDKADIPLPSPLDAITANRDAVAFLVDVPVHRARAVGVNVTLPEDILEPIDRTAKNRSKFLAKAARAHLRDVA